MIRTGDIIDGKYKILTKIGQGGMSKVWLAMDTTINKQWAVKEIDKNTEEYRKTVNENKTLTEIELMKKLSHPALPRIVSIVDEPSSLCVIMDYIEGESLDKVIEYYGKQSVEDVVQWSLEICDVLDYLHHQNPPIIYRDMKPGNVMLPPGGGNVKIIDFGIAREYKTDKNDTLPLGTRGFASPEHFSKRTDARSDVYTVGVTMYQLLTGLDPSKPPYKMLPLREVDPDLSTGLEKIITKATELDPNDRYQSIQELANAISSYRQLDDAHIDTLRKKISSFKRKLVFSVSLMLVGALLLAGGTVYKNHSYNALMESTTVDTVKRADELTRAIKLKPADETAYLELIKVYAKDGKFTESEAADFQSTFDDCKDKIEKNEEKYASLNYSIGEAFLKYYTGAGDTSPRAKLMAAEPFFQAASTGNFEKKTLAEDYVFMAEYYKTYVLADDSLLAEDASAQDYRKLLDKCQSILKELDEYKGTGKSKMMAITCQVFLNLLDGQRNEMASNGIKEKEINKVVEDIEERVPLLGDTAEQKELEAQVKNLKENIKIAYQTEKKERRSKDTSKKEEGKNRSEKE